MEGKGILFEYTRCVCGVYADDGAWRDGVFYCMTCADEKLPRTTPKTNNKIEGEHNE